MKAIINPERLVSVPFSKTQCGVDFYINTGESKDICGVLTDHRAFKTDFFSFYFIRRANGYMLLNYRKVELRDDMVLILSPHQQQEWHVNEAELDYTFLIFREDFMRTFIADKFFVYRLLYYCQTDTPPYLFAVLEELTEYIRLLGKIKQELRHPVADSYNLIVSVLYYLLVIINRAYAKAYHLPVEVPKNNYAFQFKDLLEKHIRTAQRVQEYADMLHVSRVTLNNSVSFRQIFFKDIRITLGKTARQKNFRIRKCRARSNKGIQTFFFCALNKSTGIYNNQVGFFRLKNLLKSKS